MILEEELKNIMAKEGINCFNVNVTKDSFEPSLILLEKNNIDELIRFMKVNNIKNVFYTYLVIDKDYFIIDDELIDEYEDISDDIYSLISKDIEEYNIRIEQLDFSKPIEIQIFCTYDSHYISINDYDSWCEDADIMPADEKVQSLIDNYKNIIDENKKIIEINKETLKDEFKNYVLNDVEFKNCTNQQLRRNYICHLVFQREEAKKYAPVFYRYGTVLDYQVCVYFIEMMWKEYKSQFNKPDK